MGHAHGQKCISPHKSEGRSALYRQSSAILFYQQLSAGVTIFIAPLYSTKLSIKKTGLFKINIVGEPYVWLEKKEKLWIAISNSIVCFLSLLLPRDTKANCWHAHIFQQGKTFFLNMLFLIHHSYKTVCLIVFCTFCCQITLYATVMYIRHFMKMAHAKVKKLYENGLISK